MPDQLDLVEPVAPQAVVVRQDEPASILSAIVALAKDPTVDVTKLQALMEMQERWQARTSEIEFNQALAELPSIRVKKNGKITLPMKTGGTADVPFARWEDIDSVIGPLLGNAGFRLTFDSEPRQADGGGLIVTGTLLHKNGHSRSAKMPLALDTGPGRNNLQAMGSTLSYGKRYCAEMLLNIVREGDDDDGVKGGAEPISAEECAELNRLLTESKSDLDRFLNYMGVEALPDIQKKDLVKAHNAIARKRSKPNENRTVQPRDAGMAGSAPGHPDSQRVQQNPNAGQAGAVETGAPVRDQTRDGDFVKPFPGDT